MALRVCSQAGCPELVEQGARDGRCTTHQRTKDKARGTRQQRGYDRAHELTRAALLPKAYGTRCPHCLEYMWPHQALHLDHTEDRKNYIGIVHEHCNTSDGARRGNAGRIS